ncbi:MAG: hypothetical protein ACLSAH_17625 [Bilophila wadsworthia]
MALKFLVEALMRNGADAPSTSSTGLEADDCLGISPRSSFHGGAAKVIVSVDKDMKGIPGFFTTWASPTSASSPSAGRRRPLAHDANPHRRCRRQLPGCPKIGPMTAKKLFDRHPPRLRDLWPVVAGAGKRAEEAKPSHRQGWPVSCGPKIGTSTQRK